MIKPSKLLILLAVLSLLCLLTAMDNGTQHINIQTFFKTLLLQPHTLNNELIMQLRLPRALCAFTTGGLLALAGAMMQVLLRNPLADPYILGISGGASGFSLFAMLIGISGYWLNLSAFIGALVSMLIVFVLAKRSGSWTPLRLLLTGIIIAAGWSAMISLILTISPNNMLHSMLFWLMGDLGYSSTPYLGMLVLAFGLIISLTWSRQLNMLAHGEYKAQSLGVNTKRLQLQLYFLSALLTATAVTIAGCIGFVGLIVPHMIRILSGSDHRYLLPASVLLGGIVVTVADTIARTIISPQILPVGIIMALLGVPIFLYLLTRGYQQCH